MLALAACGDRQAPSPAQQTGSAPPLNGSTASTASAVPASEFPPQFVQDLIARYKQAPAGSNPGSIWRYQYNGQVVYFITRSECCDIPSQLYTANGELLCEPDGGIDGAGDGTCPTFFVERTSEQLIWRDERVIPERSEPTRVHAEHVR